MNLDLSLLPASFVDGAENCLYPLVEVPLWGSASKGG